MPRTLSTGKLALSFVLPAMRRKHRYPLTMLAIVVRYCCTTSDRAPSMLALTEAIPWPAICSHIVRTQCFQVSRYAYPPAPPGPSPFAFSSMVGSRKQFAFAAGSSLRTVPGAAAHDFKPLGILGHAAGYAALPSLRPDDRSLFLLRSLLHICCAAQILLWSVHSSRPPDWPVLCCRFRCPACSQTFCDECRAVPYHTHLTCEENRAPQCLYCRRRMMDTSGSSQARSGTTRVKMLFCAVPASVAQKRFCRTCSLCPNSSAQPEQCLGAAPGETSFADWQLASCEIIGSSPTATWQ